MKPRCPLIILFSIVVAFPGLIISIGERKVSEAAQPEAPKQFTDFHRSAQEALTQLGLVSVLNKSEVEQAAESGLRTLQKLLTGKDRQIQEFNELGFGTDKAIIEDIPNAFPIFEISLNDLRTFSPGTDAKQVLIYTKQLLLPLSVDKQVQSSITIRLTRNKPDEPGQNGEAFAWRPTRWGQPNLTRQLIKAQSLLQAQTPNLKLGFLVSVPSLARNFLGYKDNTGIKFIPLFTNQLIRDPLFKDGESLSAEDAIKRLSYEARNVDERPR